ncbi:MAG: HEAT repeat domain-containing protein [Candidatus Riflebacteria bacterium]|nr:HEAT repeat domain-containing protein [Candidatus Riflebacteria bacterium]
MGLRPSTDYRLDIIEKGGWASVAKLRFRTPPGTHAQAVAEVIEIFDRRPRNAAAEAEYLTSLPPKGAYFRLFPDTRVAAPFTRYLKTSDPEAIASVSQFCWLAKNLRDREIAGALLPLLEHPSMASHSGAILEALAASRHPKGLSIALSMVDRVSYPEHAAAVGTILQRSGDPRHWSVLASILTRYPSWWHLLKPMVSLDRERTRRLALDWLEVPQGDRVRTEAAIHALTRLADADAARRLTSLFRVPSAGSWRETLLQSFVAQDTDEARAGLVRLVLAARADSSGLGCLWAATRLGIGQAVPLAARMARVSGDAAVRRDGIVCLALLEERSEVPLIRRALEDPDPAVSQAAAWALGRLGDSPSVPRLLARALSSADVGGVATWSLGQVGGREEAIALRALFVRLEGSPAASDQTRLGMVAWALGELGDATSAGKIRFVAGEKRFSPFARACAREALLRLAEIRSEPIGSLARTAVPRALVRCVFPFVRYDRTSVRLLPGESVDLSAQGYWGGSDPGGQMVRFDLPLPLPGLLPRPPVLADPPGDIPVGLLHMNLNSLVGGQSKLLTEKPSCLTAEREGNLVLSPLGGPRFVERSLPTVPGLGMAWVRIDR